MLFSYLGSIHPVKTSNAINFPYAIHSLDSANRVISYCIFFFKS